MVTSLRKKIAIALSSLALILVPTVALVPATAFAASSDIQNSLNCGSTLDTSTAGSGSNCDVSQGTSGINNIIKTAINIFSAVVGIVSVIMIIFGGFKYITSGGESSNVSGAKNTIIYAIIGLVVVAFAQFIVQFVLGKVTNAQ